ncbi:MAG: NUDIX domain-containing protein [Paracoccaceae bacterium]
MRYFLRHNEHRDGMLMEAALGILKTDPQDPVARPMGSIPEDFVQLHEAGAEVLRLSERAARSLVRLSALCDLITVREEEIGDAVHTWFAFASSLHVKPGDQTAISERDVEIVAMSDLVTELATSAELRGPRVWRGFMIRARMRLDSQSRHIPTSRPEIANRDAAREVVRLGRDVRYSGYCVVEQHEISHESYERELSAPIERTVVSCGDAAAVLPFDPKSGRVLLIEQFRATLHSRDEAMPWPVEIIAGRIDHGLSAEATARREAMEEAGLRLGRTIEVASYFPSPGVLADRVTVFVAEADLSNVAGVFGLAAEGEEIRTIVLDLDTAFRAALNGEIETGQALIALAWLQRNRTEIAAEWRAGTPENRSA